MSVYHLRQDRIALLRELVHLEEQVLIPDSISDSDLQSAYKKARALDEYLYEYFNDQERAVRTTIEIEKGIDEIFDSCFKELMDSLRQTKSDFDTNKGLPDNEYENLFEAAGAENLYLSNQYTRIITEKLGHKFEEIAILSHKAFDSDRELNITIRGIDVIIFDDGKIRYTQLKTKRNTLTGSQAPRSNKELSIHENSIFAAALDLGKAWTFKSRKDNLYPVARLAGSQFWSLIGIDYDCIIENAKKLLTKLERELYK
jgi:hypothetical protein